MTEAVARKMREAIASVAVRPVADMPIFSADVDDVLKLRAGTSLVIDGNRLDFADGLPVELFDTLQPGGDYVIVLDATNRVLALPWEQERGSPILGGFHYALGGNAEARAGGSDVPAINPCSIWDVGFRPVCADPRGMALVSGVPGMAHVKPFWVDLYLLNTEHLTRGTSVAGAEIADGDRHCPKLPDGKRVKKLDYATAKALLEGHGKQLPALDEFIAAAYGVSEKTAAGDKPELAGLDPKRTSRCGMMQATGNLYVWGHDGDPDDPRASVFGGYWDGGDWAGSRCAIVEHWPDYSTGWFGARGRSDHLQHD